MTTILMKEKHGRKDLNDLLLLGRNGLYCKSHFIHIIESTRWCFYTDEITDSILL